ncbi:MAG: TrkH family potassium uptake protein [Thermoplasmatota archaeon]
MMMRLKGVASAVGTSMFLIPLSLTLPFITGLIYGESLLLIFSAYGIPSILALTLGYLLRLIGGSIGKDFRPTEALMTVSIFWLVVAAFGALPYLIMGTMTNFYDAFFESMSGFTTTGASVLVEIDDLPHSILLWRSLTQWLGGLGVIVLMVALFSILMGGPKAGMLLMKGEVPGHSSERIVHRIKDTAKILWIIYGILTIAEIILLISLKLRVFDAVCHTFTTLSTGGFGTHTDSITHYRDLPTAPFIEMVFVFFMFMGGVNFVIHYNFIMKGVRSYLKDLEFRTYLLIMMGLVTIVTLDLVFSGGFDIFDSIRGSVFTVVSIQTTTGYVTADYEAWPPLSRFIVILAMFLGGMTGSTGGGIKIARFMIAFQAAKRSMRRMGHSGSVIPLRMRDVVFSEGIVRSVLVFIFAYITIFIFSSFLMSLTGLDFITSISSVSATLGNVGPGMGLVGPTSNYSEIEPIGKVLLSVLMWLGRLEIMAVMVLFFPHTYRS